MVLPIGQWLVFEAFYHDWKEKFADAGVGQPVVIEPNEQLQVDERYLVWLQYFGALPPSERLVRRRLRKFGLAGSFRSSGYDVSWPAGVQLYVIKPEQSVTANDYRALLTDWGTSALIGNVPGVVEPTPILWDTSMAIEAALDNEIPWLEILLVLGGVAAVAALVYFRSKE